MFPLEIDAYEVKWRRRYNRETSFRSKSWTNSRLLRLFYQFESRLTHDLRAVDVIDLNGRRSITIADRFQYRDVRNTEAKELSAIQRDWRHL